MDRQLGALVLGIALLATCAAGCGQSKPEHAEGASQPHPVSRPKPAAPPKVPASADVQTESPTAEPSPPRAFSTMSEGSHAAPDEVPEPHVPRMAKMARPEGFPHDPTEASPPAGEAIAPQAPASGADAAHVPSLPVSGYQTHEVFFATDREPQPPSYDSWREYGIRFLPVATAALFTLVLGLFACRSSRLAFWIFPVALGALTLGMGWFAGRAWQESVRRAEHSGLIYTSERNTADQVQLGVCEVTIPLTHKPGELEAPQLWRLEIKDDILKHVVLRSTERLEDRLFYDRLRAAVERSPQKDLFVFVHGFDVKFEDAARRTAQMASDMHFQGAAIFFSWPAHEWSLLTYPADENNINWTVPHLKQFLLSIAAQSGAKQIHLIAHSMGNRALTATLGELELELKNDARLFNQVILAAPDIDADEFRRIIAPRIAGTAERVTLYASSHDGALRLSQLAHSYPRAGDSGHGLVVVSGIETIDVSSVDHSPFGHLYYGQNDLILQDMQLLLAAALPAKRKLIAAQSPAGQPYWIFPAPSDRTSQSSSGAMPK